MILRTTLLPSIFLLFSLSLADTAESDPAQAITLTGHNLTIDDVEKVARHGVSVKLDANAYKSVVAAHKLLLLAASMDLPVYGLNRGVGINKDKTIFQGNALTPEARRLSEQFNMRDLYATSAATGPAAPHDIARAALLARLNTLLLGNAGVQPEVVNMFMEFLNRDIIPIFPSSGSMGEADITILAHIGLAMAGEGEVVFKGTRMPASQALKQAGLKPLKPFAKDALSIFSSNAYTAGMAALLVYDLHKLLNKYDLVTALSLEGLNGNIAPLLPPVHDIRPFAGQGAAARHILSCLHGSYLMELSDERALQDPLSFRDASQTGGAGRDILHTLEHNLSVQLNSSDDNPAVIVDATPAEDATPQERKYFINQSGVKGAIVPTANFEPLPWVLDFEELNIALAHMSAGSVQRTVRLGSDRFTHLTRFLAPDESTIGFAAIQKPLMYLYGDVDNLSLPVSTISYPVAGEIEDVSTNSLLVVQHTERIIEDIYGILGFELMHASQAIDLRKVKNPSLKLGALTSRLYSGYREVVPFLDKDRPLTPDIQKSSHFIENYDN